MALGPDSRARSSSPIAGAPISARAKAKVLSHHALLERRRAARAMGLRVAQCHGCFDIVHPGHIRHLRQAKAHADILLVTITGDAGYTKRAGAPLIPEELRAENLAELDCVDWVYIEPRTTAAELLDEVRPDVYIKGREYETNSDPRFAQERANVERHGGRVVFSSGDVVFSSTALIASLERSIDPYHARLAQLLARPELDGQRLNATLASMRGQRVLIVGETILDTYVHCDQPEVAAESPVMTLRPLERRTYDGGAAVIARHVAALGGRPVLLTGLPDDAPARAFVDRMTSEGVEVRSVRTDVPIAEKQRFLVGAQKVMKLNLLAPLVMDATTHAELVRQADEIAGELETDGAIIADFGNGLLTPSLVTHLCERLRPRVRVLSGDISGRRASLRAFQGADLLCPSESEAREALRSFGEGLSSVAWRLMNETRTRHLMLTMGADGLVAFEPLEGVELGAEPEANDNRSRVAGEHIPALSTYPIDPLGCGDTLLATATMALGAGGSLLSAAFLGAIGAACQAQRLGNTPVSASDVRHGFVRLHTARLAFAPGAATAPSPASVLGLGAPA
jgi:rfaE bifunctional protein nucleotidyltransferase chain/domain